ncbi:MAG: hypothetical protein CMH30_02485 [Micavibrio sp.]|nr:hypothetical protein [Micavibrio sp.]|tara:strand:+ start:491 stop:721 length:231 start_codon:yes stop_codon:yes gene_type:complete
MKAMLENLDLVLNGLENAVTMKKKMLAGSQQDLFASPEQDNDPAQQGTMSQEKMDQLAACLDNTISHIESLLKEEA